MNISKENTGDLTATIRIEMGPQDYEDKVDKALKELQRKSNLKGFRPGHVPFGLVKKMYGKAVLVDEVNKIVSEELNNFITENKLDILGYPLPNAEKNKTIDFDNDTEFAFYFDIGLAPEVDIELNDNISADYYNIRVEEDKVDDYLKNVRNQFGTPLYPESAAKGDLIRGDFVQLGDQGEILENGLKSSTSLSINFIKDENVQSKFIGKKKDEKIRFNPLKATENEAETASMLGIKKDDRDKLESDYEFTITEISRIEPAKINNELFKKVYPKDNIETEEQFRDKLREESNRYFQKESDNFFVHEVMEQLVDESPLQLPDEFVKRWLIESDENVKGEITDHDYEHYAKSLKQQLIINKISTDNGIKVEEGDIRNHIKDYFSNQYMIDMDDEEKDKQLDTLATSVMQNKDEVRKIYDQLYDEQIRELFKNKLKLNTIDISYEDFIKKVDEHQKQHHHEHAE